MTGKSDKMETIAQSCYYRRNGENICKKMLKIVKATKMKAVKNRVSTKWLSETDDEAFDFRRRRAA